MSETPPTLLDLARNALNARMAQDSLRHVLSNVIDYAARLEAERHTTNEALSETAEALRVDRDRIAELEAQTAALRAPHVKHEDSDHCQHDGERWPCPTVAILGDDERPADEDPIRYALTEQAPVVIYRAEHDTGMTLGHYATETAARAHCEHDERRKWTKSENPSFDWIEDEEDGVAEMTIFVGGEECATGYAVTALEIPAEYAPGGDAR